MKMLNKNLVKMSLAGLVLAVSGFAAAQQKSELAQADLWMQPAKGGYTVEFVSSGEVVGLQFDVKGIEVAEGQFDCGVGLASSHQASCTINAEGNLRVIVFSMENAPIPDGTMVMIRNAVSADRGNLLGAVRKAAQPTLDGVVFADTQGTNVTPDHLQ
jgi:hypothetical protein